jgi:hypothetical protein
MESRRSNEVPDMNSLPSVIKAKYDGEFRIHLTFSDSTEGTVDFASWLQGPIFEPLYDRSYFQKFFVDGGTVAWPNGADIAPETLYEAVKSLACQPKAGRL